VTGGTRALAITALSVAALGSPAPVRAAGPCPEVWEGAAGPLPGGVGPADFGTTPEACGSSDMSARVRGTLLVAPSMPDYFGSATGAVLLRMRKPIAASSWLSVAFDALTYRYVNNAGLASSAFSLGPPTVAYHQGLSVSPALAAAVHVRALLPLDTARANSIATGLEIGGSLRAPLAARWVLDGGAALAAPAEIGGGQVHARFTPVALAELWYAPRAPLAVAAGGMVEAQIAPTVAVGTVVPRLAVRAALRSRFWLAGLLEVPVAGSDRTDLVASLFLGYSP